MAYSITTNNHVRPLVTFCDLPPAVRDDFDYVTGEDQYSPRFVNYRGAWFDVNDTEGRAPDAMRARGWDDYITTSYWDGYVFGHFDHDREPYGDGVRIGHFVVTD